MTSTRISSLTILLTSTIWLSGCGTQPVRHAPVELPLPARPVLTPINGDAFACPVVLPAPYTMCMTDDTYKTIVNRERGYKTWGLELEAIIEANNAKAGK